jgi:glutathione S-transferase
MQLYTAPRAPNPRRVHIFMAEKGITTIEQVPIDLNAGEHRAIDYLAKSPLAKVPALQLDDGRVLTETRAICTYLEGLFPEPNLMGYDSTERAFIEMADRRVEWTILLGAANSIRHSHPGLATLEQPQFPEYGQSQTTKLKANLQVFDEMLQSRDWMAGERFTIADITAFCALEFARGLLKFKPDDLGYEALQAWRERVAARPAAQVL